MRVGVPFSLKAKSLAVTAGILVPLLALLNFVAWHYSLYPSLSGMIGEAAGIPMAIDWGGLGAYAFWVENIIVSLVILVAGLCAAFIRAQAAARRIVRMIDAAEDFENGCFNMPPHIGRGRLKTLEQSMAKLGDSLALMLKFLDKNVILLLRKNVFLESVERPAESPPVTVVLFKMVNYHVFARQTDPVRLNELINEYLFRLNIQVTKTGGMINKIWAVGDFYALAVWGGGPAAPDKERDAVAALRACVLVLAAVKTMNHDAHILFQRTGDRDCRPLAVAMGVDSGEALVAPIGSNERKEYSVLGDIVQNAGDCARTGAKTGNPIVITERTFALSKDNFIAKELPGTGPAYFSLIKPLIGVEDAAIS
jgi:class 3 adenylate cyclase